VGKPVTIKINGREIQADSDQYVLNVAMDHGIFVPHYCWHPGLPPEGNCRMCLVKVSTSRKLEVSCMTRCADKLEVDTEVPEVQKARKDVLEFLLINHPLDCPICDKSGECMLQDFTYNWRGGLSRFLGLQEKNIRPTKDLGPNIRFWGNRCVVCTRCVRFMSEVSGSGQLSVVQRGDHCSIDTAPGVTLDDPLSLNIVDICPVGALIDKEFLYQARVWYTMRTPSVCASCSTGCNITLTTLDGKIKRIQPRLNQEVNGYWMCDDGRRHFGYVHSERRLTERIGTPDEAARALRSVVERHGPGAVAALCSAYNTCEELNLFKEIFDSLGVTQVGFLTATEGQDRTFKNGFTIRADKTPNAAFLTRLFGEQKVLEGSNKIVSLVADDKIKLLFILNGLPDRHFPRALRDLAGRVEELILIDILKSPLSERANVLLPGAAWAEKSGTFVNAQGREQTFKAALTPPGEAMPESKLLSEISLALSAVPAK